MMNKTIGRRIRELRKEKELTREAFAQDINVSVSTLKRMESGENGVWPRYITAISEKYDVSLEELLAPEEKYVQNNNDSATGTFNINHYLSEKVIEQYEERLREKDQIIAEQKLKIDDLMNNLLNKALQ